MFKLIALYRHPENAQAFEEHYFHVHTPLAEKMPGLKRLEVAKITGAPMGESEYFLMAEMYFADKQALKNSMKSEEGRAAAADLMGFAGKIVSMHIGEVVEANE